VRPKIRATDPPPQAEEGLIVFTSEPVVFQLAFVGRPVQRSFRWFPNLNPAFFCQLYRERKPNRSKKCRPPRRPHRITTVTARPFAIMTWRLVWVGLAKGCGSLQF